MAKIFAVLCYNIPNCLIPANYRKFAAKSISDWKTKYSEICNSCSERQNCCGLLQLCKKYNVQISTSLDGPDYIHNQNRGKTDSYERTMTGIEKARKVLGNEKVAALMTTSELSLNYPKEIVDEYVNNGFNGIFLRALNPYGLASQNDNWKLYNDNFIKFYKTALDYIIKLNKNGVYFREEYATIILRKMLTPYSTGFVGLQSPAGIVNSVLIYNYDGYVYASDESRMLAVTFRLGKISEQKYGLMRFLQAVQTVQLWLIVEPTLYAIIQRRVICMVFVQRRCFAKRTKQL